MRRIRNYVTPTDDELMRIENGEFIRASGLCECETCGRLYIDHPLFEEPYRFLNRICDGSIVKL